MAHGKETPRQKMIGMMYLVLTAMLALNVQKEVLDAFINIDEGLSITIENYTAKNADVYDDLDMQAETNPQKAGPIRDLAYEIKRQADEIYNFIEEAKKEIVIIADGKDAEAIKDNRVHVRLIQKTDNMDVPAQVMYGDNNDAKGKELRIMIESFRKYILDRVDENSTKVIESIELCLNTTAPKYEGHTPSWEAHNFESLPLAGVISIMSGIQTNIRNAESEMIRYLFSRIDAGSMKFNTLKAMAIPITNYVIRGNEYVAQVFIAAFDSTQDPTIYIGDYEEIENEDGTISYRMKGDLGRDYDTIPVENGIGTYKGPASSLGEKKWGGLIRLRSPSGNDIYRPFTELYQVAEPNLTVSPTKMNVFYLGVDNPVDIAIPGIASDQLQVNITNASIRKKSGGSYIVNPKRPGNSIVSVYASIDGKNKRLLGSKEFRVKIVPDPEATVAGKKEGVIEKNKLLAVNGIAATMPEWFDFDLRFKVTEFAVSAAQEGFVRESKTRGNTFTDEQYGILRTLKRGQRVYFQDIKAVGPDGRERKLGTISLRIR